MEDNRIKYIGINLFHFGNRAENIGTTDIKDFIVCLRENTSLTELDFSNNCITDRAVLGSALGEILKVSWRVNCKQN